MIERTEPVVHAFVRLTDDAARRQVALAGSGRPTGVLHGIPFAVKDLVDTRDVRTERGSTEFAGRMPRWDATVVTQFRAQVVRGAMFARDIQALLEVGLTVPIADFLHAQRVRAAIRRDYAELFARADLILLPTTPISDLPHGISEHGGVPLIPLLTPFTFPASLTGLPAIAFPCGFTASGMPVGAQLMGPARSEPLLAAVADAYQQVTDWHTRIPPVALDR